MRPRAFHAVRLDGPHVVRDIMRVLPGSDTPGINQCGYRSIQVVAGAPRSHW